MRPVRQPAILDTGRKAAALVGSGQRGRWSAVVGLAAVVSGLEAVGTLLVFSLLEALVGGKDTPDMPLVGNVGSILPAVGRTEILVTMGGVVAGFFVLRGGALIGQAYVQYRVAHNAGARLSTRMLAGYLAMPYWFHLERNSSEMIRNAFENAQRFVSDGLVPAVRILAKLAVVVGVLTALIISSPLPTILAAGVVGPLLFAVLRVVQPRVKELGRADQAMAKNTLQSLQHSLHGWRDIALLGREGHFVNVYSHDRKRLSRARYLRRTAAEIPRVAIETCVVLFIVGFVWLSASGSGGLEQAVPVLGMFGYAAVRLIPEINRITMGLNSIKFVSPAIDNLYEDIGLFDKYAGGGFPQEAPLGLREGISVRSVSFRYPGAGEDALRQVSLGISAGESVGVIGPTGGGKSTLVDIIVGLLTPTEGDVLVDGAGIEQRRRRWQASIGLVPQSVFLVDDTVRRNVALGVADDEIDEAAVWEALNMAQLGEFVAGLPAGLETYVGERGVRVSGGQRQRLAIARALYRQPDLIVFDEGTSALDNETETAVMDAVEVLRKEHTLITVAHRLSTVVACDRVFLVEGGEIVDAGRYEELAERHAGLRK